MCSLMPNPNSLDITLHSSFKIVEAWYKDAICENFYCSVQFLCTALN